MGRQGDRETRRRGDEERSSFVVRRSSFVFRQNYTVGELLPLLYRVEERHWWSAGMRAITHALLEGCPLPEGAVVEIGCGGGVFVAELARRFPERTVVGLDANAEALSIAHGRVGDSAWLVQARLPRLPFPDESCAGVMALDVLDQTGVDLRAALAESRRVLRPGGLLLVRVSAHPWLSGPHDVAFGTRRRSRASSLRRALAGAGFRVERITYANALLLGPLFLLRWAERRGWVDVTAELGSVRPGWGRVLQGTLQMEAEWLRRRDLPIGSSLYARARREGCT